MADDSKSKQDYPVSFYFELSFKGEDAAFQEVSGLSRELKMEEVGCGGENRFKYQLPTVTTSQKVVLKRAMVPSGSQLVNWCEASLNQGLANPIQTHDINISLFNPGKVVCAMWTLHKAYPVKYALSDLKSNANELLIETIELAYTYFDISSSDKTNNLFA